MTPVYVSPASRETIERLFGALTDDFEAVTPVCRGHGGHPVLVRRAVVSLLAEPLSARLNALGGRRVRIPVDDDSVLGDFDTPGDLLALSLASR